MIDNSFMTDMYGIKTDAYVQSGKGLPQKLSDEKLVKVASEFESLLVYEMLKEMNKSIPSEENEEDVLIKKNQAEKIFNDFLTYERGKILTESKTMNLGLSDTIIKQFSLSDVSRETLNINNKGN